MIAGKIGAGGIRTVYKARHLLLNRDVVLKLLNSDSAVAFVRFQREAKLLSKLNHPNIAKIFDFGISSNNTAYLALEYIEGKTISQKLQQDGPFELEFAVSVITQLVDTLSHAHSIGIIHRDLKPSNVIIREATNEAVLLDFGIAKLANIGRVYRESRRTVGLVELPISWKVPCKFGRSIRA
ncbi:MAG: serine/threonine protein kinase [Candidatus Obscuribacterales bacterium]|nr:serine/threonine protein kinase [Candidatus Obscuribacterales bacterium]